MSSETEQIKERLAIEEIVGEYVALKAAGRHFKALCPFHQEKTPSFIVSPDRASWHCFGCNEGGDVFTFVQKIEGLDFPGALRLLAERAGVTLPTYQPVAGEKDQRQRWFEVLAAATRFYHQLLTQQAIGQKAKEYLASRGLTPETIDQFQIGYAPKSWRALSQWLARQGFTSEEMLAAGLTSRSQNGAVFDRFRGRIMFPISDVQGRVVAFGGRIVPWHDAPGEGKYVNSPETNLYAKRRTVYNLHRAKAVLRQAAGKPCLVVEGYMDVVMLAQNGIGNVVASSGTAFTPEQIALLARFTKTLHFAFDADAAGIKAATAATNSALQAGLRVATVLFPGGKDPADVALATPKRLAEYVSSPQPLIRVLLGYLKQGKQEEQLQAVLPLVANVSNPIAQGEMIQEIATSLHIPEDSVVQLVARQRSTPSQLPPEASASHPVSLQQERQLLGLLIGHAEVRSLVFPQLTANLFIDHSLQALYNSLHTIASAHANFLSMPADTLVELLPYAYRASAEALSAAAEEEVHLAGIPAVREGGALLLALQRRALQTQLQSLQQQLAQEVSPTATLQQFQSVAAQLAELQQSKPI